MVAYRKFEKLVPEVDDSWWESVLAEEERYSYPTAKQARVEEPVKDEGAKQDPDWNEVRDLYHQDRIVDLQVTGYQPRRCAGGRRWIVWFCPLLPSGGDDCQPRKAKP